MHVSARRLSRVEVRYDVGDVVQFDTNQESVRRQERRTESIEHMLARLEM